MSKQHWWIYANVDYLLNYLNMIVTTLKHEKHVKPGIYNGTVLYCKTSSPPDKCTFYPTYIVIHAVWDIGCSLTCWATWEIISGLLLIFIQSNQLSWHKNQNKNNLENKIRKWVEIKSLQKSQYVSEAIKQNVQYFGFLVFKKLIFKDLSRVQVNQKCRPSKDCYRQWPEWAWSKSTAMNNVF